LARQNQSRLLLKARPARQFKLGAKKLKIITSIKNNKSYHPPVILVTAGAKDLHAKSQTRRNEDERWLCCAYCWCLLALLLQKAIVISL